MRLTRTVENRIACACAAVGAFFAIAVLRWGMSGGFLESLSGKEGAKTLVLAVAAGAVAWVALSRKLWGHFPWEEDPHRTAVRAGEVLSVETGDTSAPQIRTTVNVGIESEALRDIQGQLAKLEKALAAVAAKLDQPMPAAPAPKAEGDDNVAKALETMKEQMEATLRNARDEVERRDKTNETLAETLKRASIQRTLARMALTLELARAVGAKVAEGKTSGADAMEFLLGDLESALMDNNVNFESVAVGTKLGDLAAGSFTPVAYLDAPSPELAGTVKEAKSAAYFIQEDDGKRRYIAPAKLILYKVQA